MVEEGEMKEPLISQVSLKEDFILFKNCFIDLGKIAFVRITQRPRYYADEFGGCIASKKDLDFSLRMFFIGSTLSLAFTASSDRHDEIFIEADEYNTFLAFLMKRLKPEQVR